MADEFVKKLGLDISDSITELQRYEKAFAKTMENIDKMLKDVEKKQPSQDKISKRLTENYKQADYRRLFDEIEEVEKAQAKSDKLAHDYRLAMYKDLFDERDRLEKEAASRKKKLDVETAKEEKRLATEAAKENIRLEKEYSDKVKESANNTLDIYTNVMSKVVNVIARAFKDAMAYVEEYDKALTSIALVTMKPDSKGEIGETYENLAKEMSVTATELAAAGEELYRQGLGDSEVLNRMEAITVYSKISGEAFSDSVEMITAAVNSFSKEGEDNAELTMHIVDTWALLGDAVATSASEIGVAMQKVAASGQAAGFTMEELSASIAVIESQTRAAAESVGTALNSMMSRYMKVSSAGWNTFVTTDEGDVVKINDIAKALESVGISIVNAKGEFLNFSEILTSLNAVWDGLSDANKNYIATQMAGTRSLNYFLSLMNNYEDVLDLTAQGYDSAGTALEKYGIWTEGVEASQNRLSAAMQDFYSNVLSSDTIIKFTEGLTNLVEFFDNATTSSGKANIGLGLFTTALMMGVSVLGKFKSIAGSFGESLKAVARGFTTSTAAINATSTAAKGATVAVGGLKAAMISIGIGLAVTAITSLVSWLVSLASEAETTAEKIERLNNEMIEINEAININKKNINNINELQKNLAALGNKVEYTNEELTEFNRIRDALIELSPELAEWYGIEKDAVSDLGEQYQKTAKMAEELTEQLAIKNWKTAADGIDTAFEQLETIKEGREQWDDVSGKEYYSVYGDMYGGFIDGLTGNYEFNEEELLEISKKASDAYNEAGYSNIFELNRLITEHSDLLDEYDEILKEKWENIFGNSEDLDLTQGEETIIAAAEKELEKLQEEYDNIGAALTEEQSNKKIELALQIEEAKNFVQELYTGIEEYYTGRNLITGRQAQFVEELSQQETALLEKEQEAWKTIVLGSSRAFDLLNKYDYSVYESILGAVMSIKPEELGETQEEIEEELNDLFAKVTDVLSETITNGKENINTLIENIPETGVTQEIITKLINEDDAIEKAISDWSDGMINEVDTAADIYIKQWRNTMDQMYTNLAAVVTDPLLFDIMKTQLENTNFSQEIYSMLAQAMTDETIDVQKLVSDIITMNNDEAIEYLVDIVVVPEVEGEESINKLSEHIKGFVESYEQYSNMLDIGEKIKLGVELDPEDLVAIAEAAELIGLENVDLTNLDNIGDAIERIVFALLQANGAEWNKYGIDGGGKSYDEAVGMRDKMQVLYDSISGIATEGTMYDFGDLFDAYPQLIQYAGDINELRDQAIILLNAEKEANKEVLEQYGLFIDESEDLANVINAYAKGVSKAEKAADKLRNAQSLTGAECKELMDEYPELTESIIDYANGVLDAEELIKKLDKAASNSNINKLAEGLTEALEDYDAAAENSYDATAALERMGYLLSGGMGNMSSLDFAMQNLDLIRQAIEGDIDAFRQLNENAVVNIVGSADVDFTAVEDGLIAVGNISEATLEQLAKLGNFEITYVQAKSRITTQGENGEPQSVLVVNEYPKIKFKDMSGFSGGSKGSSGGGGSSGHSGGGGGSGKSETNTGISEQVQKSIDEMEKELEDRDYRLEIAIAWEDYYDATGELNKTIPFMREQIEIYEEMSAVYEQNISELKTLVGAKETEINTIQAQIASNTQMRDQYAKGSKTYKKYENTIAELREEEERLMADYEALSDKLGEYELANIDVQTEIENTTREIKDQEAAIRDLIISMQESIQGFFEEIEDTENKILDATISMQDLILDTLKSQAEEEMELDREVLENKKATLTEELDAIRKNFEEARKLAQGNADEDELALLQNELAAVIADPARAGERAAIEKKIAELQSEMAWNAAEEQIAAQENAMQNEMDNIDEKIEKMEEAYDSIGKYSEKMLEEMYVIMSKTDEEIIQWLSDNSNEYADATEEGRKQLEKSWAETLKTMRDDTEKSWNEINDILNNGTVNDVLSILRNTASYRSASSEQQQKMEDEVRQAWDDMEKGQKALETPVTETITPATTTPTVTPIDETQDTISATTRARFHLRKGHSTDYESIVYMPKGAKVEVDGYNGNWVHGKYDGKEGWVWGDAFTEELDLSKLKKYAQGGLADYTGLAWLDGTPGRPEMVLDSAQTEAFRKFVFMLDKWRMPEINGGTTNGNLTVDGDIVVQVGGINTGDDYEDVGQKVMDAIYDKFKVRR